MGLDLCGLWRGVKGFVGGQGRWNVFGAGNSFGGWGLWVRGRRGVWFCCKIEVYVQSVLQDRNGVKVQLRSSA